MASSTAVAAELVLRCFNASTEAHIRHLQTRSYSAHMALDKFYHEVIDLVDEFAEAYQGIYGIITPYPELKPFDQTVEDPIGLELVAGLRKWIEANRGDIGDDKDTELQNIIDEVVGLIDGTLYKLRFLK